MNKIQFLIPLALLISVGFFGFSLLDRGDFASDTQSSHNSSDLADSDVGQLTKEDIDDPSQREPSLFNNKTTAVMMIEKEGSAPIPQHDPKTPAGYGSDSFDPTHYDLPISEDINQAIRDHKNSRLPSNEQEYNPEQEASLMKAGDAISFHSDLQYESTPQVIESKRSLANAASVAIQRHKTERELRSSRIGQVAEDSSMVTNAIEKHKAQQQDLSLSQSGEKKHSSE